MSASSWKPVIINLILQQKFTLRIVPVTTKTNRRYVYMAHSNIEGGEKFGYCTMVRWHFKCVNV